jgi:DNA-binding SARP family transcriptional activator/tetratricopeptide (TPR) repeat protein
MGPVRVRPMPNAVSSAAASVLAYLAVHGPGRVDRERLAFSLWPDRPEDKARRALSDAVYRLRAATDDGAPWLATDADSVWLDGVDVDLWAFRSLAGATDPIEIVAAVELHRGPLADGLDDEWLDLPRLGHHEAVVGLVERACGALDPAARLAIAERWTEIDPFGASAHRCLIETLLALDRSDAARRATERFEAVMADLGIDASAEIARWHAAIRDTHEPDPVVPLVGRRSERGRLVRLLDEAAAGRGQVAFVVGQPGIGKTRLLDEVVEAARWRGHTVLRSSCVEHEPATPFGPLDAAVAGAFDELRVLRAGIDLTPDVRRALGRFVPALTDPGPTDVGTADALVTALRWMALTGPVLVVLDDVQWAGSELWPLLVRIGSDVAQHPIALVAASRDGDHLDAAARAAMGELDAAGSPIVQLSSLSIADLDELLHSHGIDEDATSVHARSSGNPLVALVLAGDAASDRVDAVVGRRLASLPADAAALLRLVAVLGRTVDLDVVAASASSSAFVDGLTDAERARLLVRRSGSLEFEHDLVRTAVLDGVDEEAMRELHRQALTAVSAARPTDVLRLLGHAEGAGDAVSAATYALAAGTDALDQSASRTAERRFTRALELAEQLGDTHLRRLALAGRIRARDRLAERTGQSDDVTALTALAASGDDVARRDALRHEAEYRFAVGDYAGSFDSVLRAVGGPLDQADVGGHVGAELMRVASVALRELGRYDESAAAGRRAADAFAAAGDEFGVAIVTDVLGGIAWRSGDPARAAELHQEAADRLGALGALGPQARALNNVGSAMWALGDDRGAELVHERALAICRSLEDRQGEGDNLDNLGGVAYVRGEFEAAIDLYQRALAIRRAADDPWGVSISLSNLGDAHRALGDSTAALAYYDESLEVNRAAGVVRNEATTLQARGLALLDLGRFDDARGVLDTAAAMHDELGDRANLLQTWCGSLDVAVAAADRDAIDALTARLVGALEPTDRPLLRQEVEVSLAEAFAAIGDAGEARRHASRAFVAMDDALATLTPVERARRRATLVIHGRTDRLLGAFGRRVAVELARADAPLGVTLSAEHRVTVWWTTERPDDDTRADGAERRQQVIRRLVAEATSAGALPTDDDLADACGVTRRTIQRDIDALRLAGVEIATRRRAG